MGKIPNLPFTFNRKIKYTEKLYIQKQRKNKRFQSYVFRKLLLVKLRNAAGNAKQCYNSLKVTGSYKVQNKLETLKFTTTNYKLLWTRKHNKKNL